MSYFERCIVTILFLFISFSSLSAQTDKDEVISLEIIRILREQTVNDAGLTEEIRAHVLEQYDSAIRSLEIANDHFTNAAFFKEEREEVDQTLSHLSSELERPEPPMVLNLPDSPTVEDAENALARERARLGANTATLREQQSIVDDMSQNRSDISLKLGELDLKLELLNRENRALGNSMIRSEMKIASSMNILAQQEELGNENLMLREKLALLAILSPLNQLNIDLAKRQVAYSEEIVSMYETKTNQLREEQAKVSLEEIRKLGRQIAERLPQLEGLAAESEELAESLWGRDGVVSLSEEVEKAIIKTRNQQLQLDGLTELTIRKFDAYGYRGSLRRWWPQVPEGFPETAEVSSTIQYLGREIPEVEHTLITFEQDRAQSSEYAQQIINQLQEELGDEITPSTFQLIQALLTARQNLLDELIQRGTRYSSQLAEYMNLSSAFLLQIEDVESFLYSNVIWSRSVSKPLIPGFQDLSASFKWLVDKEHIKELSADGFSNRKTWNGFFISLLFLILLVLFRGLIKKRLHKSEKNTLGETFKAMILTGLLASSIPIALLLIGNLINIVGASYYWYASARAFTKLAGISMILELLRLIIADRGLAEAHFGWPIFTSRRLGRKLLRTEVIGLPLLYIALLFAYAGINLDSPPELQIYNNTLGRITFIVSAIIIGFSILALFRPEKEPDNSDLYTRVSWPRQFSSYAFPTVFIGAYPLIILTTIVPALLAVSGYYITALLLAHEMQRTLLLVLLLLVAKGLIQRIKVVQNIRNQSESLSETDTDENKRKREESDNQTVRLLRFAVITVFVFGLFSIWSEALPVIQIFKRVQLIPSIEMLNVPTGLTSSLETSLNETSATADSSQESIVPDPVEKKVTADISENSPDTVDIAENASTLTLWTLLQALISAAIFLSLIRNLPGVIDFALQRRSNIDAGARYAISTLFRYSIAIIGTVSVFNLLGISWSKIQWLAAALTFGLGFGLQEIVANFVSGLILLLERPVRVGDVVTVGNLTGRVMRFQIRATTITLWDRSEMIVPNKDFITAKLVNWTLSDSKLRIEIPLRIAYGSDLNKVKNILENIAESNPMVLDDPKPHTLVISFGDDSVNLELRFVVDFGNSLVVKDEVQMAIDRNFKENGIEFALPQIKVRLPENGE